MLRYAIRRPTSIEVSKAINLRYTDAFNTGNFVIFGEVIIIDSRSRNADALKSLSRYACFRLKPLGVGLLCHLRNSARVQYLSTGNLRRRDIWSSPTRSKSTSGRDQRVTIKASLDLSYVCRMRLIFSPGKSSYSSAFANGAC